MTYDLLREGERRGWGERADVYDDKTARATVQAIPDLLAAVRLAPGMRLLDVAVCNFGLFHVTNPKQAVRADHPVP